ncbi:MAG: peptide/nickel transport system permease protein [Acidimicrobiaceae bacterium]|nr:peptide/nickel transport system permease protein [Acidimicrobiaceae bacterium]
MTVAVVVVGLFALPRAMPGDPIDSLARSGGGEITDPRIHAQLQAYYGLNRPLVAQFFHHLANLSRGDLGFSISQRQPVGHLIAARLPWTLLLAGTALVFSTLFSFFAGIAAGWRRGSRRDQALIAVTSATAAVPVYALATVLLITLAIVWPVFPLSGARTPFVQGGTRFTTAVDVARHLALPATALTLSLAGANFLLVRSSVVSALGQDYLVLARAKGLPERLLKHRHAGRNALLPYLTVVGIQVGFALGGAIFVESVFAYPGMGSLILEAVRARDYPVLDASLLVLAMVALTANLAVDLLYQRLDPRVESWEGVAVSRRPRPAPMTPSVDR